MPVRVFVCVYVIRIVSTDKKLRFRKYFKYYYFLSSIVKRFEFLKALYRFPIIIIIIIRSGSNDPKP